VQEALWYRTLADGRTACLLCPHHCRLAPGQVGICRVRRNRDGVLVTRNYGYCTQPVLDPIEKKPLYHFYPGRTVLSVGTVGCNFRCRFCQNWELAHGDPPLFRVEPEQLVELALEAGKHGNVGLAYTYSEPSVWYEFVLATAKLAHEQGLKNVLVTNGFIEKEPFAELLPYIDALNIDVKGFSEEFYRKTVHGDYRPVLERAQEAYRAGKHVEITTLLVTGLNDGEEEIRELVDWLAGALGPEVPLHFSRYRPHYQLDLPPTPAATLLKAKEVAERKLHHVYLGNAPELGGADTYCPQCRRPVIERRGFWVVKTALQGRACGHCGRSLNIVVDS